MSLKAGKVAPPNIAASEGRVSPRDLLTEATRSQDEGARIEAWDELAKFDLAAIPGALQAVERIIVGERSGTVLEHICRAVLAQPMTPALASFAVTLTGATADHPDLQSIGLDLVAKHVRKMPKPLDDRCDAVFFNIMRFADAELKREARPVVLQLAQALGIKPPAFPR